MGKDRKRKIIMWWRELAWKAIHIGSSDVGNRVHTRNDSDEDVRGNAYKQTIAWKALPWSFITQANAHGYLYRQSNNQFYYKNP